MLYKIQSGIWKVQKSWDRLVCGDVGYGKTEVALRAAFKAVQESRQVVYLCAYDISCTAALQHGFW